MIRIGSSSTSSGPATRHGPFFVRIAASSALVAMALAPGSAAAQSASAQAPVPTYAGQVARILNENCVRCHRPNSVAPMSLLTYEEVRPWAPMIEERTQLRDQMGVMPPWFVERGVGIQHFSNDEALSEEEIATLAAWADAGAPLGNRAELPPQPVFADAPSWDIGEPDLIVDLPAFTMQANAPDWWGVLERVRSTLAEDRYVQAMQVLEISDAEGGVGGNFIFHHAIISSAGGGRPGPFWPVHEVGRNAQHFDPSAAPLLRAGSEFFISSAHMHANDRTTTANLRLGFKFHPVGYVPEHTETLLTFGNGEIDLRPEEKGQVVHAYHMLDRPFKVTSFEPHMHASGVRMCLDAIWAGRTETINCVGYDHNWVKVYSYDPDRSPLFPAGTLVRITAYFDTTSDNANVVDPRNWQGLGHRSIDNMAITFLPGIYLTDEEFAAEIARRREIHGLAAGQAMPGCPLCGYAALPGNLDQ